MLTLCSIWPVRNADDARVSIKMGRVGVERRATRTAGSMPLEWEEDEDEEDRQSSGSV